MHRLMLISYHFPPSEEAGALRWQRLAPIAARHGWEIDAITLAPGQAGRIDWSRVHELPETTRIHGVPHPEPRLARLHRAVGRVWRAHRGLPGGETSTRPQTLHRDEVGWLVGGPRAIRRMANVVLDYTRETAWRKEAVRTGLQAARARPPEVVVSCGPPHRAHEAGRRVARGLGVPFAMDLRDPWSLQHRLHEEEASQLWYEFARREEGRCVRTAGLIVMNTPIAAAAMEAQWPGTPVISVLNGWDDEPLPQRPWPRQFRVVFAGTIYIDRNPSPFFRAVGQVVNRLGLTPQDFEVRLIGEVASFNGQSVEGLARNEGMADFVRMAPRLPRREVLEAYAEAAVLLSLPQDSHYAVPSKIFEYMRQPCWLLAQTSPASATGMVLENTPAYVVPPEDVDGISSALTKCYREFQAGRRPQPIANGDQFSRAAEGARLFAALDALVEGNQDRVSPS